MTNACPCCGQAVAADPLKPILADVSPLMGRVIVALLDGSPRHVERLAATVYADRADGGPECANRVLSAVICRHRQILKGHGIAISARRGRASTYQLERLQA